MRLTYRYRLFPTQAQRAALQRTLDICQRVYNEVLHGRKQAWEERGESLFVVGIDLGLSHFATLSTGEQAPNPRFP